MTTDDLARLRSLAEAATPGPWTLLRYTHGGGRIAWFKNGNENSPERHLVADTYSDGDREFIAALDPQTVLALLDAAEASERHSPYECGVEHRTQSSSGEHLYDDLCQFCRAAHATPPPATVDERCVICQRIGGHLQGCPKDTAEEAVADAATEVFIDAMQEPSR